MHVVLYSISKFIPALQNVHYLYVLAVLFVLNVAVMLLIGRISPRATPYVMQDVGAVDLTPWKYRKIAAIGALCLMCCVYLLFSPSALPADEIDPPAPLTVSTAVHRRQP